MTDRDRRPPPARFLVASMRPAETDGWSEAQLATLITRDCMIGTGVPKKPSEVA